MRVSIDARYIRERPSGIGAYVRALVDRIPGLAPEDSIHLWVDPRVSRPLSPLPNVDESVVRAPANGLRTLLWPARLAPLSDVDVLHEPFNLLGRGVPCASVVTVHDLIWLLTPSAAEGLGLATAAQALFYRDGILRALREAARIVAISHATADSIRLVAPEARARVRVIPHGVEARFHPAVSASTARRDAANVLGSDGERPYFLVVGQNAPFKNHGAILQAFAAADLGRDVRLVLLQRLYGGKAGRRAEALGLGDRVLWRGPVGADEVVHLMRGALGLIQFSRYEGFGMPALEAMASGTPVIASDIPALSEVLGGAGLEVPLDVAALAKALRRVATEPGLRAELAARGVERARAFSWDESARLHLETYREAAAAGKPAKPCG